MSTFEILHALALRRKSDVDGLVRSTGIAAEEVERALAEAIADGRVVAARGTNLLAPKGAAWLQERYPEEFGGLRADAELAAEYERFEAVNQELKSLITRWQTRSIGGRSVPNDHSDPEWDAAILDRLGDLHERAERWIERLARKVPRFALYAERLAEALDRAEGDELEFVSGVRCDSYHMVWYEMHEDLLRTLGRKREE
jgi:hypothetical protein